MNIISVSSRKNFNINPSLSFFGRIHEKIRLNDVESFEKFVGLNFSPLAFRDRRILDQRETVQINITPENSYGITKIKIEENPMLINKNKSFDGIITDLNLFRYSDRELYFDETMLPHGVGIVSWAIQHCIPVGIVYEDRREDRKLNFWLESTIDTLEQHPSCFGNKIPSGDIHDVCIQMIELFENENQKVKLLQ